MEKRLENLIEAARSVKMTPQEREAQRRSFAYGNTQAENPRITRKSIDKAAEKLAADHEQGHTN